MTSLHPITPSYKEFKIYRIPDSNANILSLAIYFTAKASKPSKVAAHPLTAMHLGKRQILRSTTDGIAM